MFIDRSCVCACLCALLSHKDYNFNTVNEKSWKVRGNGELSSWFLPWHLFSHPFHVHFQLQIYDEFYDSIKFKEKQPFKRCPEKRQIKILWNTFQNNHGLEDVAILQWFSKCGLEPAVAAWPGSLLDKPVSGPSTGVPASTLGVGPSSLV